MSTLAEIQAGTLTPEVARIVVASQFATDWLMVVENDFDAYSSLMEEAGEYGIAALSDHLRVDWEVLAEQVTELVEEHISPIAGLIIAQLLKGQGSLPFDIIAQTVKDNLKEAQSE